MTDNTPIGIDYETYGWTKTDDDNYEREKDTFSSGCNICGGTQFENPDEDWYCWHEGQTTHLEQISIGADRVCFIKAGEVLNSFPATQENIETALKDPFDVSP